MSDISTPDDSEIAAAELHNQEHSIVSDPYCSVKSKLFAPTSSFLNSKYVPPEVISEEPRPLPGSKNAQFKDVKSKLGRLTQAAINQQYVQPGTSPAPESKIHTTTFSPDERREIWERLLKPTQSREAAKYVKPPPPPTEPKDFYVETVIRQSPLSLPLAPRVSLSGSPISGVNLVVKASSPVSASVHSELDVSVSIADGTPSQKLHSLTPEERREAQKRLTTPNAAAVHGRWTGGKQAQQVRDVTVSPCKLSPAERLEAQRRLQFPTYAFDAGKWTGPKPVPSSRQPKPSSCDQSANSLDTPAKGTIERTPEPLTEDERREARERLVQPTQAYIARLTSPRAGDQGNSRPVVTELSCEDSEENAMSLVLPPRATQTIISPRSTPGLTAEERREARERLHQPTKSWSSLTGDLATKLSTAEVTASSNLTPNERREARERLLQNTAATAQRLTPMSSTRSSKHFFPDPEETENQQLKQAVADVDTTGVISNQGHVSVTSVAIE